MTFPAQTGQPHRFPPVREAILAHQTCPCSQIHQTFFLLPCVTSYGVSVPFKVGCHWAAISGIQVNKSLNPLSTCVLHNRDSHRRHGFGCARVSSRNGPFHIATRHSGYCIASPFPVSEEHSFPCPTVQRSWETGLPDHFLPAPLFSRHRPDIRHRYVHVKPQLPARHGRGRTATTPFFALLQPHQRVSVPHSWTDATGQPMRDG